MKRYSAARVALVLALAAAWPVSAAPVFTAGQRQAFLTGAETQLRASAKVSDGFWAWLDKHADIKNGLLTAADPTPPVYAENLDLMRQVVGPARADRYAHLLLAVSLRATAIDPKSQTDLGPVPDNVKAMAAWMKANHVTYLQAMGDKPGTLTKAGLPAALAKDNAFWGRLPYEAGTYPPRLGQSIPDFVTWVIDHFEQPAPADAKQAWPLFPLDKAPYPLLVWYQQTVPRAECDWAWERYWGRVAGQPAGIIGYGRYTWDYEKPEVKYRDSDWNPSAIVRMWSDGGVCGRLSTMADCFRRLLALPAQGVGQPGHRAFIAYSYDARSGRYGVGVGQSIAGLEATTCGLGLPYHNSFLNGRAVHCYATVAAMNLGLDRYQNGQIAALLAKRGASPEARRALYEEAVQFNPYHLGAWKELAELTSGAAAANALLARLDSYLFSPDGALALTDPGLSPDTDFAKLGAAADPAAMNKMANYGTDIARIVGDALAPEMYQRVLRAGGDLAGARDLLRTELARREAKKVPYGAALSVDLATRFDLAADGLAQGKESAAAAVAAADRATGKPRASAVANALTKARLTAEAQPPREAAAWIGGLQTALEAVAPRLDIDAAGAAAAEGLFAELQKLRAASLGRLGKPGAAEVKALGAAWDKRLKEFAAAELAKAREQRDTLARLVAQFDRAPAKDRAKSLDTLLPSLTRTARALPPAEADAWLSSVLAEIKARRPVFALAKGKPVTEAWYGTLRGLLTDALRRAGEPGRARLDAEEAAYQADLKAFTASPPK
ncbi:MAG: hypothetical protein HZB16_24275 [Armatimonadetes bacterium]|nr:hypothetical protein [Armatimonadota bacterium]